VVHIHTYYNWRYVYSSALFFNLNEPRFVLHEHSDLKNINQVDKLILPKLDSFIAVNQAQVSIAEEVGISKDKIFLVPNIVRSVQKLPKTRKQTNTILMVGNIRREKNYELAIQIVQQLSPDTSLDIYGNINDNEYFSELQTMVEQKGLFGRINFITNETNVAQHYSQYSLALHTASSETGPLVLYEYLSAGMPFFCSTAGQSSANIARTLPGVIINSYNPNDWVDAINGFLSQSEDERQMLLEAMESTAGELLNMDDYYHALMEAYSHHVPV
jgi:glycosyltransferase involved in cell wall biosynthesis